MKNKITNLTILLCVLFALPLVAQKREKRDRNKKEEVTAVETSSPDTEKNVIKNTVSGKVVDTSGNALIGVLVTFNEGADHTTTDIEGKFTILVKQNSTVVFDYIGYHSVSVADKQLKDNLSNSIVLKLAGLANIDGSVELPYQSISRIRTTSNIAVFDPKKELERDSRADLSSSMNGKLTGLLGANNIHGIGKPIYVVDGIRRDEAYINMLEVESVTVLKDAVSRMLFGAQGDQGVVLVKTKSGAAGKKVMKVNVESGINQALLYPKFLNAAQYMTTYNKAQQNDASFEGTALLSPKYAQSLIDNTQNKVDPTLYPDNDYFSNEYVKDASNFTNINTELSGGNASTQYFLNMGLSHNDGWINIGENNTRDVLNIHAKVNFKATDWMKMTSEVVGVFDINSMPNVNTFKTDGTIDQDFWAKASTYLPNTQSMLIPISRISNASLIPASSIIDGGYVLGGSSVFKSSLYGDMTRSGNVVSVNRYMQFNNAFDIILNGITKGLTAKGLFSLNFNNTYDQKMLHTYSVYQMGVPDASGNFAVTQVGVDNNTSKQVNSQTYFDRTLSGYASLNYDRVFGDHAVTAVLVSSFNHFTQNMLFQQNKNVKIGLQANYSYKDKYLFDLGVLSQGSSKMPTGNKFGVAPTFGLGWVISKENFMKDIKAIDFLKLRASYGVIQNDNWLIGNYNGYFLYETNYALSLTSAGNLSKYTYGNGNSSNTPVYINSFASNVNWQTRKEMVVGFDLSLMNNTWVEASYFTSENGNCVTQMSNNSPSTLGSVPVFQNFNTTLYKGVEVGVKHAESFGKLKMVIGANYIYTDNTITKIDEPIYNLPTNSHLSQTGKSGNALWGYQAAGLYMPEDFDTAGKLLTTLPTPTFGTVKPGDIKYVDYNKDNKIDQFDRQIIGSSSNNQQLSIDIDLKYNNWQFYALAVGQFGGKGFTNSSYFWFKGNSAKYSEVALKAFDPLNPDPNAAYPRLSLGNSANNYNNSTFWMYDKSNASLSVVQLGYNFKFRHKAVLSGLKLYARGNNLVTVAKDLDIVNLNYQSAPKSRTLSLGLIASF